MKMSSMARMGSSGNTKLLSKYGGRHKDRPYKFANGGVVGGSAPRKAFADGGPIDGGSAKPRLDRPSAKRAKPSKKGGKTTVNVVVAGKGGADGPPPAPPMGGAPMPPPPGPPGPPMPMRKDGGRIANLGKYAHGGRVKFDAGAGSGEGREEKSEAIKRRK